MMGYALINAVTGYYMKGFLTNLYSVITIVSGHVGYFNEDIYKKLN